MPRRRQSKPPVKLPPGASFSQLSDDVVEYSVETDHGHIAYSFRRESVRSELRSAILFIRAKVEKHPGIKVGPARRGVHQITGKAEESFVRTCESLSEYALYMFERDLSVFLKDMSSQYAEEVFYRVLRVLDEAGVYKRKTSEVKMLEATIARHMVKDLKRRLGAPTRGGDRRRKWTGERDEAFYALYERCLAELQRAKEIYRRNKDFNWREMVKADNPLLPEDLISKLHLQGDSEPGDLAREYAASLFGVENNSTLKRVITRARRARAAQGTRKRRKTIKR